MKRISYKRLPKQQRLYIALAVIGLLLSGASHTFAQENDVSTEPVTNAVQQIPAKTNSPLTNPAQNRITNLSINMVNRTSAAIDRLENITKRIQSRADKLDTQGVNTIVATQNLPDVLIGLDLAANAIESMPIEIEKAISSDEPQVAFGRVKTTLHEVYRVINDVYGFLQISVTELKAASSAANTIDRNTTGGNAPLKISE